MESKILPFAHSEYRRRGVSPSWYSELLEYTHDAIIIWAMGGEGIRFWNRAAELLYGYRSQEVIGLITHDLLKTRLPIDVSELERAIARDGTWIGELQHTTRDGQEIRVESRLVLLPNLEDEWLVAEINREVQDSYRSRR